MWEIVLSEPPKQPFNSYHDEAKTKNIISVSIIILHAAFGHMYREAVSAIQIAEFVLISKVNYRK